MRKKQSLLIIYLLMILSTCIHTFSRDDLLEIERDIERGYQELLNQRSSLRYDPKLLEPIPLVGKQHIVFYDKNIQVPLAQGFQLTVENPFKTTQEIELVNDRSYRCTLGKFKPGEIRTYNEKDLPEINLPHEMYSIPADPSLIFQNGKKSSISISQTQPKRIIDLCTVEPKIEEEDNINHLLNIYYRKQLTHRDQKECIDQAIRRYKAAHPRKTFTEKEKKQIISTAASTFADYRNQLLKKLMTNEALSYIYTMHRRNKIHYPGSVSKRFRECSFCHKKTVNSSLYCVHCNKIDLESQLNFPENDLYASYGRLKKKSDIQKDQEILKIYDAEKKLFAWYPSSSGFRSETPQKKENAIWFDARMLFANSIHNLLQIKIIFLEKKYIEKEEWFNPDEKAEIYCASEVWTILTHSQKEELRNFCLKGGVLAIYHAEKNNSQAIGFGRIIHCIDHYSTSSFCKAALQKKANELQYTNAISYSDNHASSYYHPKNNTVKKDETQTYTSKSKQYRKWGSIPIIASTLCIPIFIIYFRKKNQQRKMLLALIATILLCMGSLTVIFIIAFEKPLYQCQRISLCDENSGKLYELSQYRYFCGIHAKNDFHLKTDTSYSIFQRAISEKQQYSYDPRRQALMMSQLIIDKSKDYIIKKNSHQPGKELVIIEETTENTREKLVIDLEHQFIYNGYSTPVAEALFIKNGKYFFTGKISPGAKGAIEYITQEEFKNIQRKYISGHIVKLSPSLKYFEYESIDYALIQLEDNSFEIFNNQKIPQKNVRSLRISLLATGGQQ